jgi:hypothetical protein
MNEASRMKCAWDGLSRFLCLYLKKGLLKLKSCTMSTEAHRIVDELLKGISHEKNPC